MPTARALVVDRAEPGWYQCVSRCVRRAFLCGDECEHRRQWLRERLMELAGLFEVDVAAYAVLANHYHVLLYAAPQRVRALSDEEVARRWLRLFPGSRQEGAAASQQQLTLLLQNGPRLRLLRERLSDLSWFMRCLNEWIARRANREDRCSGRFWEGRFKCRRLLDAAARLACAVYMDLNPIRAGLASTPEASDYTSVQDRILARQHFEKVAGRRQRAPRGARALFARLRQGAFPRHAEDGLWLSPVDDRHASEDRPSLAGIAPEEYLELVDATGRVIRPDKRGAIPGHLQPILVRLDIDESAWSRELARTGGMFGTAVGSAAARAAEAIRRGTKWIATVLDIYRHSASERAAT
jgi:REP element-mobilizing transposase RayT